MLGAIVAFGPTFAFPIIGAMGGQEPQHANFATRQVRRRSATSWSIRSRSSRAITGVLLIIVCEINLATAAGWWLGIVLYLIAFSYALFVQRKPASRHRDDLDAAAPGSARTAAGAPRDGQADPARRDVPRRPDRRDRLPDGGQARQLIRVRRPSVAATRRYHGCGPARQETDARCPTSPTVPRRPARRPSRRRAHLDGDRLVVDDEAAFRDDAIRDLAWTAAFADGRGDDRGRAVAGLGGEPGARRALGEHPGAVHGPGRGEVNGFTVPAINIRAQTFDMARTVFEAAAAADVGAVILELARSEQTYTFQRPIDYATAVLAGAIAAGWRARSSSRATTTSSTPRSTPPTRRR